MDAWAGAGEGVSVGGETAIVVVECYRRRGDDGGGRVPVPVWAQATRRGAT